MRKNFSGPEEESWITSFLLKRAYYYTIQTQIRELVKNSFCYDTLNFCWHSRLHCHLCLTGELLVIKFIIFILNTNL